MMIKVFSAVLCVMLSLNSLSGSLSHADAISKLNQQSTLLEDGVELPMLDVSWATLHANSVNRDLNLKYAQEGYGDVNYSPSEVIINDLSGFRRGIVSGSAKKVVSMIGLIQSKVPIQIDGLRFSEKDFEDHIELVIIVRGSIK